MISWKIRVTAVVREQNGELKVLQVHMSEGSRNQLEDEIFPRTMDQQHARALFAGWKSRKSC